MMDCGGTQRSPGPGGPGCPAATNADEARVWLHNAKAQGWRNRPKLTDVEDTALAREEQALADLLAEIFDHNDLLDFAAARYGHPRTDDSEGGGVEPRLCDLQEQWSRCCGTAL